MRGRAATEQESKCHILRPLSTPLFVVSVKIEAQLPLPVENAPLRPGGSLRPSKQELEFLAEEGEGVGGVQTGGVCAVNEPCLSLKHRCIPAFSLAEARRPSPVSPLTTKPSATSPIQSTTAASSFSSARPDWEDACLD